MELQESGIETAWTGYPSCTELPFVIFIDCLVCHQYRKLVLTGEPGEEELADHWLKLYSEFHVLSGDTSTSSIVAQIWQRDTIRAKIHAVKNLLTLFGDHPKIEIVRCIEAFGFSLPPFDGNVRKYEPHIARIVARLKSMEGEARQVQKILDALKGDEITKQAFTRQLNAVSRHNKYHISINDITTGEYCEYVRAYREYVDSVNNTGNATTD